MFRKTRARPLKAYNPKEYWVGRLEENFNIDGVGFDLFGKHYNEWMYKMKKRNLQRVIQKLLSPARDKRVLDIGCGTGFYVDVWLEHGVKYLTGIDISNVSTKELSNSYPKFKFYNADISSPTLIKDIPFEEGNYDIITAIDVLFHIVDDDKFEQAIKNIELACSNNAVILITDIFPHKRPYILFHQKSRTLEEYVKILSRNGIEIIDRIPVHYLLNAPVDISSALLQRIILLLWWQMFVGIVERTTHVLGPIFSRVDLALARFLKESPSTEMIICKHK